MKLVIIGGGPAGETAARTAAKEKVEVTLIEKKEVGGLCLNHGCIPSKTLLSLGKKISEWKRLPFLKWNPPEGWADQFWRDSRNLKEGVIQELKQNLEKSLSRTGVQIIRAEAKFKDERSLYLWSSNQQSEISFDKAIVAVGSSPLFPPPFDVLEKEVLNSDSILDLEEIPESLLIVGGGAVGCEFACLFHELGTNVTILEKTGNLIPGEDPRIVQILRKSFESRGIRILDSITVQSAEKNGDHSWTLNCSNETQIQVEKILVCVGRKPNLNSLDLEKGGIRYTSKGISVDAFLKTSNPNIFAIGDVNGLSLLAHASSAQGEIAARNALGSEKKYDGSLVPRCLYTWPEVASVGMWNQTAEIEKIPIQSYRSYFKASGRATCEGESEGMIQILTDERTEQILGAQILGPHATEMIHILALAIRQRVKKSELQELIFAHPTYSEMIHSAFIR